jgi:hypothetical protein
MTRASVSSSMFSTFMVCRILSIKYGRLKVWIEEKFVRPTKRSNGIGDFNLFSLNDLYLTALFLKMTYSGLNRKIAANLLKPVWKWRQLPDHITFCFGGNEEPTIFELWDSVVVLAELEKPGRITTYWNIAKIKSEIASGLNNEANR